jgi:SAM-dependent methyltransferase
MTSPDIAWFYRNLARSDPNTELAAKRLEVDRKGLLFHAIAEARNYFGGRPPRTIAELGGGLGTNLVLFGEAFGAQRLVSLDLIDPGPARLPGIEYVTADLQHLPTDLLDARADLVLMIESLSHMFDPDAAVESAKRLLSQGGLLVLTTPNLSSAVNRLAMLAGYQPLGSEVSTRRVFGRPGIRVTGVIRLFTFRALKEFLGSHNLRVLRMYTVAEAYDGVGYRSGSSSGAQLALLRTLERTAVLLNPRLGFRILATCTA